MVLTVRNRTCAGLITNIPAMLRKNSLIANRLEYALFFSINKYVSVLESRTFSVSLQIFWKPAMLGTNVIPLCIAEKNIN